MSTQLKVFCDNLGEYIDITGGETLWDIYSRVAERIPFVPMCAHVNCKTEDMLYPVYSPKKVEFLSVESPSGHRTYIRSLCMLLFKAVCDLYPGTRLRIEHSISKGYYCRLKDGVETTDRTVESLKTRMRKLVDSNLSFERKERLTSHVVDLFRSEGLDDKVKLLDSIHELYTVYYKLDNVSDSYYGSLVPFTGMLRVFELLPFKDGMLLLGPASGRSNEPEQPVTQEKMYRAFTEHLDFNAIVGVRNVGELNATTRQGGSAMLINVSEALHSKKIAAVADEIKARFDKGGAKIALIAGPSSSGKTTFTKRLAIQLITNLLEPRMISLDDYFVDREATPKDETGDYDYESIHALDIERFNADLNSLLSGDEVELPTYNFATGRREFRGNRIKLNDRSILLIEGIHGLNPQLTQMIEQKMKFRIYVSALTTISIDDHNWIPTTDNRLLRRIIRDYKYRGVSASETIRRWPSVRRGEEKWIFPHQENADATFNSSLLYELAVIRDEAEQTLRGVPHDIPEYAEAARLLKFLSYFNPIGTEYVPSTSLIREFLGGSSFRY